MKKPEILSLKIMDLHQLQQEVLRQRLLSKTIAFTNGCFDILHQGHISSLSKAAKEADFLVVGVNSDASARKLKGPERPVNNQEARTTILASLLMVDAVIIFDEDTPLQLIKAIMPDVLVKGGDYFIDQIVGAKEVIEHGGRVVISPLLDGYSTSGIIQKIQKL